MNTIWARVAIAGGLWVGGSGAAHALSLAEFLDQVEHENLDQRQYGEQRAAGELAAREAELTFAPSLFFNAESTRDHALSNPPLITYSRIEPGQYALGVSKQFTFGLQSKLSYRVSRTNYVNPSLPANLDFWDTKPILELSLPLWANGFGRGARAQRDLIAAQAGVGRAGAHAQSTQLRVTAETTYWRLAVAVEALEVQKRALKSAEDVREYVTKKSRMNLGERSDVVQAAALVEARQLQVQQARNDARVAAQDLNALRQVNSSDIPTVLDRVDTAEVESMPTPGARPGDRVDLATSEAQAKVAQANSVVIAERNKPTLELYGSYALNGRASSVVDATENISAAHRNTNVVGLRFNMPLDYGALGATARAALLQARSTRTKFERDAFVQDKDWTDLTQKIRENQANLKLVASLEAIQTEKLTLEKQRLKQGRTSTYQVLLFEQDLLDAQLNRLRNVSQAYGLRAQLNTFERASAAKGSL